MLKMEKISKWISIIASSINGTWTCSEHYFASTRALKGEREGEGRGGQGHRLKIGTGEPARHAGQPERGAAPLG